MQVDTTLLLLAVIESRQEEVKEEGEGKEGSMSEQVSHRHALHSDVHAPCSP